MSDLTAFREEVSGWLEANCPKSMRKAMPADEYPGGGRKATYKNPETKLWLDRMAERGFTVPMWPKEYGGGGLTREENQVLAEELRRINARPAHVGMGISMIGPALLEFGTEAQKLEHLPKIARGEIWWCQGYSEPNAGSDLASLRTSAVEDGDEYIINGQKIWTSGADNADWIFCLVRTDPEASKHDGITFVLFDMAGPGITVKPILLISGLSPFCETFFDNARASKSQVGERSWQRLDRGEKAVAVRTDIDWWYRWRQPACCQSRRSCHRLRGSRKRQDRRYGGALGGYAASDERSGLSDHHASYDGRKCQRQGPWSGVVDVQILWNRTE